MDDSFRIQIFQSQADIDGVKPEIPDVVVRILLIDFLSCNLGLSQKKISNCKSANLKLNALTAA